MGLLERHHCKWQLQHRYVRSTLGIIMSAALIQRYMLLSSDQCSQTDSPFIITYVCQALAAPSFIMSSSCLYVLWVRATAQ